MTAIPKGMAPTGMVAITVLVAVEITETVVLFTFETYTLDRSGVTATAKGEFPTGIVVVTVSVLVEITETVLSFEFGI